MKKKFSIALLAICTAIMVSFGFAACTENGDAGSGQKTEITLSNYIDLTVSGTLNQDFTIGPYLMAVDQDGDIYEGTAKVSDADGNVVAVAYNRFVIEKTTDYKVEITVTLPNGTVKTRTITVKPMDNTPYQLSFSLGMLPTGLVGVEYTLPTAVATRYEQDTPATVRVYYVNDGEREEQAVTDGKFTPAKDGTYVVVAEKVSEHGKTYTKELNLFVEPIWDPEAALNPVLVDYVDANAKNFLTGKLNFNDTSTGSYVESYTDKNGVTKNGVGKAEIYYGNQVLAARFNKYTDELRAIWDNMRSITFTVLIEQSGVEDARKLMIFGVPTQALEKNVWHEITLTKADIETKLQSKAEAAGLTVKEFFATQYSAWGAASVQRMFGSSIASDAVSMDLYVDQIKCTLGMDDVLEGFGGSASTNNLSGKLNFNSASTGSYLESYTDKNGETKLGVGKAEMYYGNQCLVARFNRTSQELLAVWDEMESITYTVLIKQGDVAAARKLKIFGVYTDFALEKDVWYEITLTKAQIEDALESAATNAGKTVKELFAGEYCATGAATANRMFGASIASDAVSLDLYLDSIVVNFAEAE